MKNRGGEGRIIFDGGEKQTKQNQPNDVLGGSNRGTKARCIVGLTNKLLYLL